MAAWCPGSRPKTPLSSQQALLRQALSAPVKEIPTPWLYDAAGSRLYEAVTRTPEYYLGRLETRLMLEVLPVLTSLVHPDEVIELGSGVSSKTMHLLEALGARERRLLYRPVDVSPVALQRATRALRRDFPLLRVEGFEGTYQQALEGIERRTLESPLPSRSRLVVFLGGTLGNLDRSEQEALAWQLRTALEPGQSLLIGTDLAPHAGKSVETIRQAYDDPRGAMERFNRHALERLVRELGATLRPSDWRHVAVYDHAYGRVELALESPADLHVTIPGLELELDFRRGERLLTAISRKFDPAELVTWFEARGFRHRASWQDDRSWVMLTLFERA